MREVRYAFNLRPPLPFEESMIRRLDQHRYETKKARLRDIKNAWKDRLNQLRAERAPWADQVIACRNYTAARDKLVRFIETNVSLHMGQPSSRQSRAESIRYRAAEAHRRRQRTPC